MWLHNIAVACADISRFHIPHEKLPKVRNRKFKLYETRDSWIFGAKRDANSRTWLHASQNDDKEERESRRRVVDILQREWGLSPEDARDVVGHLDHLRGNVFLALKGQTVVGEADEKDCCTTTWHTQKQTRLQQIWPVHPPASVRARQGKWVASLPWRALREKLKELSSAERLTLGQSVQAAWNYRFGDKTKRAAWNFRFGDKTKRATLNVTWEGGRRTRNDPPPCPCWRRKEWKMVGA